MSSSRAYSIILDMEKPMDDDAKSQAEKFQDLARELECDEDEAAFDERLRRLVTAPKAATEKAPD